MAAKSSKNGSGTWDSGGGAVDIDDMTDIVVDEDGGEQAYSSSSTAGQTKRLAGTADSRFSFNTKTVPPFSKTDIGTLVLKNDAGTEIFNKSAFISNITQNVPIEGGAPVEWSVTGGQA